jgi:uncharacterized membrane protein YcaP (DUF421 family)
MNETYLVLKGIFGLDTQTVNIWQMAMRAAFIYISSLIIIRFGNKRFLGKNTAFDFVIGIVIGSVFSRAINGNGQLFVTISAGVTLVLLHWLFAVISLNHKGFANLVKGKTSVIINNYQSDLREMKKGRVSEDDIKEQLRLGINQETLENVRDAYLERDGQISFIKDNRDPKILDIKVESGVQTVRIKLE